MLCCEPIHILTNLHTLIMPLDTSRMALGPSSGQPSSSSSVSYAGKRHGDPSGAGTYTS